MNASTGDLPALLRRVVDHVPSPIAYWDRDQRCRFANDACRRWFGLPGEAMVGRTLREVLGEDAYAACLEHVEAALKGEPRHFERDKPAREGSPMRGLVNYLPDIVGGQVVGFVAYASDVTDLQRTREQLGELLRSLQAEVARRRAIEAELAETRQALSLTLASMEAGFIATDAAGRVAQIDAVAQRLTGWSLEDARGRSLWDVFERADRPQALRERNPIDVVIEEGLPIAEARHHVLVSRQGVRTPIEVKADVTRTADGRPCGLVLILRDQTRLLRAEIEANRLAAIVESSQDAIISKTLDGTITSWNGAAEAMFGYTADEAVGRSVLMLIPEERRDEELRIIACIARGERVPPFDTVRRARDGHLVDISLTISPVRDGHGRIIGASKIARDITLRRQAEEARRKAERLELENRQIQESSRLKSQFLANMSHELRTPLNAIIGFADVLNSGIVAPDSPRTATYLGHIANSGRHLLQLINDVLDLSKVEAGKFRFAPESVALPALVGEVCEILQGLADSKHIALVREIDEDLDEVFLDPGRLRQVLYNFASNAIKFTPAGGRVTVRARVEDARHFRLEVEDTGIGIAADDLPRLFVEFQQLDTGAGKRHEGTGLGLALTRRLVEAQGGVVGVRSEAGRGSVFHCVLNRIDGIDLARREREAELVDGVSTEASAAAAPRQLLVIEDDSVVRARLINGLSGAGYHVLSAATAAQATRLASEVPFDALMLDLHLPGRGGLALLDDLRGGAAGLSPSVIGVTSPGERGGVASFAIADILAKPLGERELAATLGWLARGRAASEGRARVLVVDDDPAALALMHTLLDALDLEAHCQQDGRQALALLDVLRPDALVLDLVMPGFDGFQMLEALHRLPAWRDLPVFLWTSLLLTDAEYASLARSARAIVRGGGGDLVDMLERVRRWQPRLELAAARG